MKISQKLFCVVVSSFTLIGSGLLNAHSQSVDGATERQENAVLQSLREVAWASHKPIQLYYCADCTATKGSMVDYSVPFPSITPAHSEGQTGVSAVQQMFKNAPHVSIAEDSGGIIKIHVGKVAEEVLETKLSVLAFDRDQQYDPNLAIAAIENTREMNAAMTSLGMASVPILGGLVAPRGRNLPHLPGSLRSVTVDQVLDLIAKTWGGPVVYGACDAATGKNGAKLFALWYGGAVLGTRF
ncbi:MAG: hypothetical protein JO354_04465 [Verrucomicrobia bacterium]|nr:hypothetical protein [Verrucomicrobiota bacterium]